MARSAKDAVNARSLNFLRPIFRILRKTNNLVLMRFCYANTAGHTETVLIETEWQLKNYLRKLPPRTIVIWKEFEYPWLNDCPQGLTPNRNGELEYGAY